VLLEIAHIFKSYPGLAVLHDLSLTTVGEGEIVCLLGPSGCGKSTLLRIVAGLEMPDAGQVVFDGRDLAGEPPHRRHFGLMFQDYALFPHKDVAGNVAFGLRMARLPASEIGARVREMLARVGLSGYEQRRVTELSGGEQQRVALARSLAPGPRLLMFDEPLGALDRALREQLMNDLRAILKQVCVTALYVTHDQEEAFAIGDRVAIMRARPDLGEGGRIEQIGTPQEVYRQPANAYVARFLGFQNLIDGTVAAGEWENAREGERERPLPHSPTPPLLIETPLGTLIATGDTSSHAAGDRATVLIRPEAAEMLPHGASGPNTIQAKLVDRSFRGSYTLIRAECDGGVVLTLEVSATGETLNRSGEVVALRLDPAAISLLPG
jgi:ABC-type Fe3+/spermidine/putrescine transport system ATPase subunit